MRPLGVAHLSAINLPPPALIETAAEVGFSFVGLRLIQVTPDSPGYPLMENPQLLRQTCAAIRSTGIHVQDVEFVRLTPQLRVEALIPMLDVAQQLGARYVITAPYDPDLTRLDDTLTHLATLCRARDLRVVMEFFPWTVIASLEACWTRLQNLPSDIGILIDSLHFDRSGSRLATLMQIPSTRIPFVQLADAPVKSSYSQDELLHTARCERLPLGGGAIALQPLLQSLPSDIPISLEIPRDQRALEIGLSDCLKETYQQTIKFFERNAAISDASRNRRR